MNYRTNNFWQRSVAVYILLIGLLFASTAIAASSFVVKHIRVQGLQRVQRRTVLNYVPIRVGQRYTVSKSGQIIRKLYATGFFSYVGLERQGSNLIIVVQEHAVIGNVTVTGNKDIPDKAMKSVLKKMGLVEGEVFKRQKLQELQHSLQSEYINRGKYDTTVSTKVRDLPRNRVGIKIIIEEGKPAKIKAINFIGNHDFSDSDLQGIFLLKKYSFITWFTGTGEFSKIKFAQSLEAIREYYMNHGYLRFRIISHQVTLTPDHKHVYITIKLHEGAQYHFSGYDISGKLIMPRAELDDLVLVHAGDVFSRSAVTDTIDHIGIAFSDKGYGFPLIKANPQVNEKNKTVRITFVVHPGRKYYVRRIIFSGNTKTADYVLRHAMRQDEAALMSLSKIRSSERHLRVMRFLSGVDVKTTPVPGTNDQIDLDYHVHEASSATARAQVGYSQALGFQVSGSVEEFNFMGTGRTVGVNATYSRVSRVASFNYYDPYYSVNDMGRGFDVYYQYYNSGKAGATAYSTNRVGVDLNYDKLIADNSHLQWGIGVQHLRSNRLDPNNSARQIQAFVKQFGRTFNEVRLSLGWDYNSYDQFPFPTDGLHQSLSGLVAIPADSKSFSYYKVGYTAHYYHPLPFGLIFTAEGNIAYGNDFSGGKDGLPFFEYYYAGGLISPGQVRGFDEYSLGPRDSVGNALGGNFLVNGSVGIVLPHPVSGASYRTTVFLDAGNVYQEQIPTQFLGTKAGPIRYSAGVGVEWHSPFGPLNFSLAKALNKQAGDETTVFGFGMHSDF